LAQAPDLALLTHGQKIQVATDAPSWQQGSALVNLPPEPCTWDGHLPLVRCGEWTFRHPLYTYFVALEIGFRRLLLFHVAEHPTSEWALQQVREALPGEGDCKFLLHHRHKTFSASLDETVESWGTHVLRSPVRMPTANADGERLIGTIRRECPDYVNPFNPSHLRRILGEWSSHYIGPCIPDQPQQTPSARKQADPLSQHVIASRFLAFAPRVSIGKCRIILIAQFIAEDIDPSKQIRVKTLRRINQAADLRARLSFDC
jgi:hypothetical protein